MRLKLTKRLVDGLEPSASDQIVWDTDVSGFGVKVTPAGRKTYFLYYRNAAGVQRRPTIGQHGTVTVEEARKVARQWAADKTLGGDVSGKRAELRLAVTISTLAERYLSEYAEVHKKPSSIATDRSNIRNHIVPLIGSKRVIELRRSDIDGLRTAIKEGKSATVREAKRRGRSIVRGGEGIANRVVALVSKMLECAVEWELRTDNPARGVRKYREKRKDRFLDEGEVGRVLAVLDDPTKAIASAESQSAKSAIKFLLFTGLRSGEVQALKWDNFDADNQLIKLQDSKTGARIVPLNEEAFACIARNLGSFPNSGYVFEGKDPSRPITLTRAWYRVRSEAQIDASANLHCLRHTFASWSVMRGLSLPQVGSMLGHRSSQTTLRYADHVTEAVRGYSQIASASLRGLVKDSSTKA